MQKFEAAECACARTIKSLTLIYRRFRDASPLRHAVDPSRQPRSTDVPTPQSAFVKKWVREETVRIGLDVGVSTTESSVASLYVFENKAIAKKLEVFAWSIEQGFSLHYAFLLQLTDK